MARGLTLEQLIYNLRVEIGQSTNAAVSRSTRARFTAILNRHQRRLWYLVDWPFLNVQRDIPMQAGSRYYDFPVDIDMDRQIKLEYKYGVIWNPVTFGIGGAEYNQLDSDNGIRSDPVLRWKYYVQNNNTSTLKLNPQFEVWPVPTSDAPIIANPADTTLDRNVRVNGTIKCNDMVNQNDVCLLDGDMIVGYCAAEILAKMKQSDAQAKLSDANGLLASLKGRNTPATPFKVGGDTFDSNSNGKREIQLRVAYTNREGLTY